jgi:hypothetical protein
MTGFFYDIRGFFDAKFSGRYLSLLLRELGRREPALFSRVFGLPPAVCKSIRKGEMQVEHEWHFETKRGTKRRADLVVLKGGEPILLVEVKEDDVKNQENPAQLADYLSMLPATSSLGGQQVRLVHVSRFSLPPEDQAALQKARKAGKSVDCLRYRNIYEALRGDSGSIGSMLREYLEDIMVASYNLIDLAPGGQHGTSLAFLLSQMLGCGLGRLNSDRAIGDIPHLFKLLFGNLEVLGDWIREHNQGICKTRFSRNFESWPGFNLRALRNALNEAKGVGELPGKFGQNVPSGAVWFNAWGKISSSKAWAKGWVLTIG